MQKEKPIYQVLLTDPKEVAHILESSRKEFLKAPRWPKQNFRDPSVLWTTIYC